MNLHSEEVALCTCVAAGEGISLQNLALREARHIRCRGYRHPRHRHQTRLLRTILGGGIPHQECRESRRFLRRCLRTTG